MDVNGCGINESAQELFFLLPSALSVVTYFPLFAPRGGTNDVGETIIYLIEPITWTRLHCFSLASPGKAKTNGLHFDNAHHHMVILVCK